MDLPFLVLLCWTGCMPSVVIHVRLQRLLALTLPFPPHVNREKKMVLLTWCNREYARFACTMSTPSNSNSSRLQSLRCEKVFSPRIIFLAYGDCYS